MSETVVAVIWVALFVVVGAVVAIALWVHARNVQARTDGERLQHYRELAERATASQQQTAAELARLTERVTAVERLLREVG